MDAKDEALLRISVLLEEWADASVHGGWSTHQVEPMRRESQAIRKAVILGRHDEIAVRREKVS